MADPQFEGSSASLSVPTPGGLRIAVLIKQVPRSANSFDSERRLIREADLEMSPCCRRALAHAVRLAGATGGDVTAITLGPESARDVLLEARACGADRTVHLCDRQFAGSDCLATARALAAAIDQLGRFDLIIAGASSTDAATAAVPLMLAELLDLPCLSPVLEWEVEDGPVIKARLQHDDADERVLVRGPAVVAVAERSCAPARADRATWPTQLPGRTLATADLGPGPWGAGGSPTVVRALIPTTRSRSCRILRGTSAEQAAQAAALVSSRLTAPAPPAENAGTAPDPRRSPEARPAAPSSGPTVMVITDPVDGTGSPALIAEAAGIADRIGGHVTVVAAGSAVDDMTGWGADTVLRVTGSHPRPLAAALTGPAGSAWAVLAPATGWAREVLARLAVRLGTGYVTDATELLLELDSGPRLIARKPAGDAHLAEVVTDEPQLISVRTGYLTAPVPRRVRGAVSVREVPVADDPAVSYGGRAGHDLLHALDRATVVIGVGRGVDPADYPALGPLRALLNAELAGSRPVVDKGALPRGRQLGLTGRSIAPRLYVAIGISGSSNHVTAIGRADTVVAINTDADAPIFSHADIGIVADWRDAVPVLTAALAAGLEQHA